MAVRSDRTDQSVVTQDPAAGPGRVIWFGSGSEFARKPLSDLAATCCRTAGYAVGTLGARSRCLGSHLPGSDAY